MITIIIEGGINTNLTEEQWSKEFLEWLQSRGEYFGGSTDIYEDEADETGFEVM